MHRKIYFYVFFATILGVFGLATTLITLWLGTQYDLSYRGYWDIALLCTVCELVFFGMQIYTFYTDVWWARVAYRYSSYGIVYMIYILLGIGFLALMRMICIGFGIPTEWLMTVTTTYLLINVLVLLWGVLAVRRIALHKVQIPVHLPVAWRTRRIVWVSDIHVGSVYRHDHVSRIVSRINSVKPDMVLVGGDLFDGTTAPDLAHHIAPLRDIIAPLGTYFIMGNHEEFRGDNPFAQLVQNVGMKVLQDESIDIDGVQFVGVDFSSTHDRQDFAIILSQLPCATGPSILLKHEPTDLDIARDAGFDAVLCGHTHNAQLWPLNWVARLSYQGYVYGIKALDTMWVVISSGAGTWGPPVRVGTQNEILLITFGI